MKICAKCKFIIPESEFKIFKACGQCGSRRYNATGYTSQDFKIKTEQHKHLFEFMSLIGRADKETLLEMQELLEKEIRLSDIAIKQGFEK